VGQKPPPPAPPPHPRTVAWWQALSGIAVLNITLWFAARNGAPDTLYAQRQLVLAGVFTFVCAYRTFLPRIDLERWVMVDSGWSSIFLGRAAATVAEVAFAGQCALLLHELASAAGLPFVATAAWGAIPLLALAQVFCWYSVLSLDHLGHAIEEAIWGATHAFIGLGLGACAYQLPATLGKVAFLGFLVEVCYVTFMFSVDVPMYLERARRSSGEHLGPGAGLWDALNRRVPTRSWAVWRPETAWLTGYFSGAVWLSLAMVFVPVL